MTELILVVEDKPEEQDKAKAAVKALGFQPVVAGTLADATRLWERFTGKIVGVITDVHFPEGGYHHDAAQPNGLAIVAGAVIQGVPVAVCSDIDHHYAHYVKAVLTTFECHQNYAAIGEIPFAMDHKDWNESAKALVALVKK